MKRLGHAVVTWGLMLGIVASLTSAAVAQGASDQPLTKINIGGPSAGYWNTYIAQQRNLYKQHGLDPTFYWFPSGAPLLAGLKSGSIDAVVTGLAIPFALGQHIPLNILYWEMDNGQGDGLMATEASGIKSYRDIAKAKAVGVQPGTCSQVALQIIADKAGVSYDSINKVSLPPPNFASAFTSGSINAATGWAPWSEMLPAGVKVVSWDSEYGGVCPSMDAIRPEFLKEHPRAGLELLQTNQEARELVSKDPSLAVNALVSYLKIPQPVAEAFYKRHCCDKLPTVAQQLDPNSPYSLVAPKGGVAQQLYIASKALYDSGTIPRQLSWEEIDAALDPSALKAYASGTK